MAGAEIQPKLGTVLGYREKCITRALCQMRGKTHPVTIVREPHLGKSKTGNIAKIQGELKLQWLVEHGHGENSVPNYSSVHTVRRK